jgi:phenylacetate-CoA ligase
MHANPVNLALFFKNCLTHLPLPMGQAVAWIPYSWRPGVGIIYRQRLRELKVYDELRTTERKEWILQRMRDVVQYAAVEVPFYRSYYARRKFDVECLRSFDDLQRIPCINKDVLLEYDLESRSRAVSDRYLVNTGGSSGRPLAFYVQSSQMGNELAHMHTIWAKLGYRPHDLKLTFGGRSNIRNGVEYDFIRHSLAVDLYAGFDIISSQLRRLLHRYRVSYLHGYPSAIYEFALYCQEHDPELLCMMRSNLKGVFLGSEYPMPRFRQTIEGVFGVPTVSWYGHTERCILAYERHGPFVYYPFQTYGYAEAVVQKEGRVHLVGTSYYNRVSPMIRYDTEDEITAAHIEDSLLISFQVENGRQGQFIVDQSGKNIPLTGLIFGRHHRLFDFCSHIQVHQSQPGEATILFVPLKVGPILDLTQLFDTANVGIQFSFCEVAQPIKTPSGKVNLLLTDSDLRRSGMLLDAPSYRVSIPTGTPPTSPEVGKIHETSPSES